MERLNKFVLAACINSLSHHILVAADCEILPQIRRRARRRLQHSGCDRIPESSSNDFINFVCFLLLAFVSLYSAKCLIKSHLIGAGGLLMFDLIVVTLIRANSLKTFFY